MEIVKASFEILGECPTDINEALKWIELAGRTAYQSHDKITDNSAKNFCVMITKRGHLSVIEHSNLVISKSSPTSGLNFLDFPVGWHLPFHRVERKNGRIYIGGNYRAWLEAKNLPQDVQYLMSRFLEPLTQKTPDKSSYQDFQIVTNQNEIPIGLKRIMVKFIIPRGLTHELVRHRPCSFLQESTRYVRYKDLHVIQPPKLNKYQAYLWRNAMLHSEIVYSELLDSGCTAEIARSVLPIATKAEIIVTADIAEWAWIFELRCSPAAHVEMRAIMRPLKEEFLSRGWL